MFNFFCSYRNCFGIPSEKKFPCQSTFFFLYVYYIFHFSLVLDYAIARRPRLLNCCAVTQLCPILCNPMVCSMPGFPVLHCLQEFAQSHVNWASDAIEPSCPLTSPSPPALNLSQHQGLFQWVSSLHQVAKYWSGVVVVVFTVLEFWSFSFSNLRLLNRYQLLTISKICQTFSCSCSCLEHPVLQFSATCCFQGNLKLFSCRSLSCTFTSD